MSVRYYGGVPRSEARLVPLSRKQAERWYGLLVKHYPPRGLPVSALRDMHELQRRLLVAAQEDSVYALEGHSE